MTQSQSRSLAGRRSTLLGVVIAVVAALLPATAAHAATAPGPPQNLQASLYVGGLALSWDAPVSNGGSPILDYVLEEATNASGPWSVLVDGVSPTTNVGFGNRVPGQTYWYRVSAINAIGAGPTCPPISIVYGSIPLAPTNLTAGIAGDKAIGLTWSADLSGFGDPITDFVIERAGSAGGPWTVLNDGISTSLSATVTGLTAGQTYWFRVKGVNSTATGQPSNLASATAISRPLAVTGLTAIATGATTVHLTWINNTQGGTAPIDHYLVLQATDLAGPWSTASLQFGLPSEATVELLTPRTPYYFVVRTHNAAGDSPLPDPVSSTPGYAPEEPQQLKVTPGDGSLTVTWLPPVDDGGNPLGGYRVSYARSKTAVWTDVVVLADARAVKLTGLLNGTAYDVKVVAMNQLGMGPAATATATPITVPGAPRALRGAARSKAVALTWLLPSSTGGSAVTNYVIQKATAKAGPWRTVAHPASPARKITVKNLKPKKRYYFRVATVTAAGRGAWSAVISVVPKR